MRGAMTAAALAVGLFASGLSATVRPQEAAKPDPISVVPSGASAQSPGAVTPVVTETRRRQILQEAEALTSDSLSEVPVARMRKDLPGRIDKVRKSLGVTQYGECERRASDWIAVHRQPRKQ